MDIHHPADVRYTRIAVILHWLIAALIIFNLSLGLIMEGLHGPVRGFWIPLHMSIGMTVLILTLARICWRLTHRPPALFDGPQWEHLAAHLAHFTIYALMLGLPVTGWAIISAHPPGGPGAPHYFGLFKIPALPVLPFLNSAVQKQAHDTAVSAHTVAGYLMIGLLVLHVLAALKHQFIDRHPQFRRMSL
ncbi:MAG: cytochrome b [Asticcacaulis sp.]|uniref:cytochrome b n=1 Tax=Asticcacaulis sp. TaxID=1872648 RepID=UPI0039E6F923